MDHVCFTMRVDRAHLEQYERMHREAWPELLVALHEAGWQNYGLFLRDDGFLVGHLEAEHWPTARAAMDAADVSPRWSAEMDRLVVPGTRMRWLNLLSASPGAPVELDAAVAVGTRPAAGPLPKRTAVFAAADGTHVAYAEREHDASSLARSLLRDADQRPFRRVFDLEHQLAALQR